MESLLLAAFFFSSGNVVNELTNRWSQNASVFRYRRSAADARYRALTPRRSSIALAALCGLLWSLLLVQDFYTGAFTFLLAALLAAGVFLVGSGPARYENGSGRNGGPIGRGWGRSDWVAPRPPRFLGSTPRLPPSRGASRKRS